jgi:hypothetical protein
MSYSNRKSSITNHVFQTIVTQIDFLCSQTISKELYNGLFNFLYEFLSHYSLLLQFESAQTANPTPQGQGVQFVHINTRVFHICYYVHSIQIIRKTTQTEFSLLVNYICIILSRHQ